MIGSSSSSSSSSRGRSSRVIRNMCNNNKYNLLSSCIRLSRSVHRKVLVNKLGTYLNCDDDTKVGLLLDHVSRGCQLELWKSLSAIDSLRPHELHHVMPIIENSENVDDESVVVDDDGSEVGDEVESREKPTTMELAIVSLSSGVPFVGFGFMDNLVMIVAGEYIDHTLGVALNVSTMAAAALGNLISDCCGVGLGGTIETWSQKLGIPQTKLSPYQLKMSTTRFAHYVGCVLGVSIGCFIGMFPLLFLDNNNNSARPARQREV